jgi:lysozyme
MGIGGLLTFKNTLLLIKTGQYKKAADEMLKSLWAKQVGNRAIEDSNILKSI